ncbi:MAG: metallophosphoesterase [Clostridia bacterium]|nr:metallophosphoesterase [Clostridia bacterium]
MKKKKATRVLSVILAVIVAVAGVSALVNTVLLNSNIKTAKEFPYVGTELKVEDKGNGVWNIYSDKELKVMQLTDVHLGGGWISAKKDVMALNAVAAMIKAEKPDFVVISGDMAYPVPVQAGTFNNKSGAKLLAELMETLGVYWTGTFGNHDTEAYSYFDREYITEFYSQYPHCLIRDGAEGVDGYGNQVFNIINSDGLISRSIITIDSHSYVDGDIFGLMWKYDNIHENQIEWYRSVIEENNEYNKFRMLASSDSNFSQNNMQLLSVPSTVFLHIPVEEYKTAWDEYAENGYKDTENVKYNYGKAGESNKIVYHGVYSDNFFETMLELGSTDSVFCGHDHLNGFSLTYKGIDLNYSYSVDYLAYTGISKLGSQRGCTVMTIDEKGNMEYTAENYYQDKYESYLEKEEVTMQELGQ